MLNAKYNMITTGKNMYINSMDEKIIFIPYL